MDKTVQPVLPEGGAQPNAAQLGVIATFLRKLKFCFTLIIYFIVSFFGRCLLALNYFISIVRFYFKNKSYSGGG
jgi:hypothetical protein